VVLEKLDRKKYTVPEDWPLESVRQLFKAPEVIDPAEIEASKVL
jgi:flap endonuclease-1